MVSTHARQVFINVLKTTFVFAIATGSSVIVRSFGVAMESVVMVFLLGVLFTTVLTSSYVYGIIQSVVSLMVINFLFTEPLHTLVIASSSDVILLLFFLVTAIVSGVVTSRLQQQMALAARNARNAQILYQIASGFLSVSDKRNIVMRSIASINEFVTRHSVVLLDRDSEKYALSQEEADRPGRDYAIRSSAGQIGTLRVLENSAATGKTTAPLDEQTELIIQAVAIQLGIALDREQLRNEQENIRIAMERERLRATLLRSVAHDLRSPLTALSGAGSLLADDYDNIPDAERRKLASDISEEIVWLVSLVENILNMTRINESQLVLRKSDEVIDDVVSEAISHVSRLMKDRRFTVQLPEDVLMAPMDGKLIVRVLINLLENAIRHTTPDSLISLSVAAVEDFLEITVSDTGNGIDESIRDTLFERFVTVDKGVADGKSGIGLGLAICKAIVEAHGGTIEAQANQPSGARLVFTLPLEAQTEIDNTSLNGG